MRIKTHFHINGFALSLALKQRLEAVRKLPPAFGRVREFSIAGNAGKIKMIARPPRNNHRYHLSSLGSPCCMNGYSP